MRTINEWMDACMCACRLIKPLIQQQQQQHSHLLTVTLIGGEVLIVAIHKITRKTRTAKAIISNGNHIVTNIWTLRLNNFRCCFHDCSLANGKLQTEEEQQERPQWVQHRATAHHFQPLAITLNNNLNRETIKRQHQQRRAQQSTSLLTAKWFSSVYIFGGGGRI